MNLAIVLKKSLLVGGFQLSKATLANSDRTGFKTSMLVYQVLEGVHKRSYILGP
jgi:hypothetical protein